MFAQFDFSVIANSWVYLFQVGMAFTLELTVLSMIGGVALGTLLALGRMSSSSRWRWWPPPTST